MIKVLEDMAKKGDEDLKNDERNLKTHLPWRSAERIIMTYILNASCIN